MITGRDELPIYLSPAYMASILRRQHRVPQASQGGAHFYFAKHRIIPASHILSRARSRFAAILPSVVVSTTTCNVYSVFKAMCTGIYCQIVFLTVNPRCDCKPPLSKGERPFCLPVVSCFTGESPCLVRPRFSTLVAAATSCRSLMWARTDVLMPCP